LNVSRFTETPVKSAPPADALGAGSEAGPDAEAAVLGALDVAGAGLQADATTIKLIAAAIGRNRDTGTLLLTPR
jgi:hypothetical protein